MELLNEVRFFETIENLQLEECISKEVQKNISTSSCNNIF